MREGSFTVEMIVFGMGHALPVTDTAIFFGGSLGFSVSICPPTNQPISRDLRPSAARLRQDGGAVLHQTGAEAMPEAGTRAAKMVLQGRSEVRWVKGGNTGMI